MSTVTEYLANVPAPERTEIERLMTLVRQHVPNAEEGIAYGMPAFKYKKQPLIYFGAFSDHLSLFPTSSPLEAGHIQRQLKDYTVSKGTIQFTLDHPLPDQLVIDILNHRLRAIDNK